jgi:hypothetical protein
VSFLKFGKVNEADIVVRAAAGQAHEVTEEELEYDRGVERMRKTRDAAEK